MENVAAFFAQGAAYDPKSCDTAADSQTSQNKNAALQIGHIGHLLRNLKPRRDLFSEGWGTRCERY
jgi:hypothetical protein